MDYKYLVKKSVNIILIILIFLCSCALAKFYIPFVIAYIFSLLMEPVIKYLMKITNFTRKTCSIIVLICFFIIIFGFLFYGVMSLIFESSKMLNGINDYFKIFTDLTSIISEKVNFCKIQFPEKVYEFIEDFFLGIGNNLTNKLKEILSSLLNGISELPNLAIYVVITVLATYFITSDKFYILDRMEHHLSRKTVGKLSEHVKNITCSLGKYLKAEITLIGISFFIVLVGLNIFKMMGFKIEYPVLMAIFIGFVDALPILGIGTIMVPWIVISFINGEQILGFMLIGLYIFTIAIRQLLEPKIVSGNIGIHPIFTIISMYTGFKILGLIGMIVGPIFLIILKNVFSEIFDMGFLNFLKNDY